MHTISNVSLLKVRMSSNSTFEYRHPFTMAVVSLCRLKERQFILARQIMVGVDVEQCSNEFLKLLCLLGVMTSVREQVGLQSNYLIGWKVDGGFSLGRCKYLGQRGRKTTTIQHPFMSALANSMREYASLQFSNMLLICFRAVWVHAHVC